ncbi:MAG TPA: efflux RND transporter periplasmic adaptor subunit [Verrucomicrobiota bacterium]|nr:efflux RND transporter periplasmic adaptor subunit [Verrucomicrobiota bacterium]HNT15883.1 efflux RND transporter periplasmic adaptor subunit [Verrucomicrobiota bacterium]
MNTHASPSPATPTPVRLRRMALVVAILVLLGLAIGLVPRSVASRKLSTATRAESVPIVSVISPTSAKADWGTPLPADVQAFIQASIHARASGYLKAWFVDIGDRVTNGQVLAEIDTPELDQQLAQAQAEVHQAQAGRDLAKITADRWAALLTTASVSEQETAEKQSDLALKTAHLEAAQANYNRLQQLQDFARVVAPFTGTITARNTDVGQLITAGNGPELFRMAQTDPLRVYVRVPQQYVRGLVPGQNAELTFVQLPGRTFTGKLTRTAGAMEPASRTLQVELQVDNPNGEILAGSYAQVRFNEAAAPEVLQLSGNALLFRAEGLQVAVLAGDNKVSLRAVTLGRDFGKTVEVLSGLSLRDRVIENPPDFITDGMVVQVAPANHSEVAAQ